MDVLLEVNLHEAGRRSRGLEIVTRELHPFEIITETRIEFQQQESPHLSQPRQEQGGHCDVSCEFHLARHPLQTCQKDIARIEVSPMKMAYGLCLVLLVLNVAQGINDVTCRVTPLVQSSRDEITVEALDLLEVAFGRIDKFAQLAAELIKSHKQEPSPLSPDIPRTS